LTEFVQKLRFEHLDGFLKDNETIKGVHLTLRDLHFYHLTPSAYFDIFPIHHHHLFRLLQKIFSLNNLHLEIILNLSNKKLAGLKLIWFRVWFSVF
jgi:hypothetical protein